MSVGHIARVFETAGISTIIVAAQVFERDLRAMSLPRVLLTPYTMGRPLGYSGETDRHDAVVRNALDLLHSAKSGGTVKQFG